MLVKAPSPTLEACSVRFCLGTISQLVRFLYGSEFGVSSFFSQNRRLESSDRYQSMKEVSISSTYNGASFESEREEIKLMAALYVYVYWYIEGSSLRTSTHASQTLGIHITLKSSHNGPRTTSSGGPNKQSRESAVK
jgi:hypothetical protein